MKVGTFMRYGHREALRFEQPLPVVGEWVLGRRADGLLEGEMTLTDKVDSKPIWMFDRHVEEGYDDWYEV
jgi:hypothetical protein